MVVVPVHTGKLIGRGLLRTILNEIGIERKEFLIKIRRNLNKKILVAICVHKAVRSHVTDFAAKVILPYNISKVRRAVLKWFNFRHLPTIDTLGALHFTKNNCDVVDSVPVCYGQLLYKDASTIIWNFYLSFVIGTIVHDTGHIFDQLCHNSAEI